jgi:glycerophosphoryl diester phosphodiesterase
VLTWARDRPGLRLFVEVKGRVGQYPRLMERLYLALLQEPSIAARTHVISFEPWWIGHVRELLLSAQTGLIYNRRPADPIAAVRALRANAVIPAVGALKEEDVRRAHEAGLEVYPWTVDSTRQIEEMLALGVDGVITNDVALARRAVDRRSSSR